MQVTWHGHATYTIKGASATVVTDPYEESWTNLKLPKLEADVVLVSHGHGDHSNSGHVSGDPKVVDIPGEYEYGGVMIDGLATFHDDQEGAERGENTVFSFTVDGIHFVHLGDLGHTLTDEQVERLGDIDILFIPVGGTYTIDAKAAVEVVKQLQPRVTVPMHYDVPGLKLPKQLTGVDDFLKQAGGKVVNLESLAWKFKPSDLPEDESQIVVFPNP